MSSKPNNPKRPRHTDTRPPAVLARLYGSHVQIVLETADTIVYQLWNQWTPEGTDPSGDGRRDLQMRHTLAKNFRRSAHKLGKELLDLPEDQAPEALTALHTEFHGRLTERFRKATDRYQETFPSCHHACGEHRPYGLGIDSTFAPGTSPDTVDRYEPFPQRPPSDTGSRYEALLYSATHTLDQLLAEVHETNEDDHYSDDPNRRQRLAAEIDEATDTLNDIVACAHHFNTYDADQAAQALTTFYTRNEKRLDQRIHDTWHRLQHHPSKPCDNHDCDRNYPGYPQEPWSPEAIAASAAASTTSPALRLLPPDDPAG